VRARHRPRQTPQTLCSLSVSNIGARSRNWFRAAACIPISLLAVLVGLSVWGILGGLLAGPVTAALNVTLAVLYPSALLPPEPQAEPANVNDGVLPSGPRLE
jgi:hypothetical protein